MVLSLVLVGVWSRGPALALPRAGHPGRGAGGRALPVVQRSALDGDAHRARGTGDDLRGGLDVVRVEVLHLGLRDLADLVLRELGDLGLVRLAGALGHAGGLLDQLGGRRRLGDERERAVLEHGDLDRDHVAALGLRRSVVRLDELHDVHAVLTQRRADRRRRGRGPGLDLQLDEAGDLLLLGGHRGSLGVVRGLGGRSRAATEGVAAQILATWLNDSSTGVSRPKMDTSTLSFCASGLISEIVAGRVSKGPSMTVTDSPTSKSTTRTGAAALVPGFSLTSRLGASMEKTSLVLSGTGWWVLPTNPVTPGVCRTAPHDSSVRSIRTSTYPGIRTLRTSLRWPFLISLTSSMGTSTWKM